MKRVAMVLCAAILSTAVLAAEDTAKNGEYKQYYPDGELFLVENYKDGKLDGKAVMYYPGGRIDKVMHFKNGSWEGEQKSYYENGQLQLEWTAVNGQLHGMRRYFADDGTLMDERRFEHDVFIRDGRPYEGTYRVNFPDGSVFSECTYAAGLSDGICRRFHPNGQVDEETSYMRNLREGVSRFYDENGRLLGEWMFRNDKLEGLSKRYHPNGKVAEELPYVNNFLHGTARNFDEAGMLTGEYEYREGVQDGVSREYASGRLYGEWEFKNGTNHGTGKQYYPNGKLQLVAHYDNGEENHSLREEYYEDGRRKGLPVVLDQDGNKILFGFLWFIAFLFSLVLHEAAHAWAALKLGDPTAYEGGQVSLNPVPHIRREPLGTMVIPVVSYILGGWMIGWASAPYDPRWAVNHPKRAALMSLAGPAANFLIVVLCFTVIKIGLGLHWFVEPDTISSISIFAATEQGYLSLFAAFVSIMFSLNLILCFFNLLPLPPLDGSGAMPLILPDKMVEGYMTFINQASVSAIGLFAAWKIFDYLYMPIFETAVRILHPTTVYLF